MAQLIQPFNAHNVDPTQSGGSLPVGKYVVVIESSDVKATKANDGGYLLLSLKIMDGPHAGGTGPYRINLYNASPEAVKIAEKQLSALSHVTGVFMVQDTTQFHGIPFMVEVGPQKNDPQYTEVKRVFDVNGNEPGRQGQGGGQQGQGQQGANGAAAGAWSGQGNPNAGQGQQGQGQGGNAGGWGGNAGGQQGQQGQQGQGQQGAGWGGAQGQGAQGQGAGWGGQGANQGGAGAGWGGQQTQNAQGGQGGQGGAGGWQQNQNQNQGPAWANNGSN